ncbi:putative protein tyrosine kinase [Lyophyllum shimeji]|uniref:Protein kinase domain-containing protein n=1 Tax=Lyophyllum shimeji TaxID=47721 RepID=A0A9P3PLG4_LYOSH|nr:putative protein tyrosine kinase [Lyophyllum shimeji]
MTAQKASLTAFPSSSRSATSRFFVQLLSFGLFTKYQASAIGSLVTDASASLAAAIAELQNFSPYLNEEEFNALILQCQTLTQRMENMEKLATKKMSVIGTKKFESMIEAARAYEEKCNRAQRVVKRTSAAAQERAADERFRMGLTHRLPRDKLKQRIRQIRAVEAALRTALHLPEETREVDDIVEELQNFFDMQDGTMEDDLNCVDPKVRPLVAKLRRLLRNLAEYRQLVACRSSTAERLLDMFQELLDILDGSLPGFRSHLLVATQRLAYNSGRYPTHYTLRNVTPPKEERAVHFGGFAEIWRGHYERRSICLKVAKRDGILREDQWQKVIAKESILWGQLSHPNVLPFYGLFEFDGKLALVSPWMEHNLTEYLVAKPDANRLLLALDVVEGLRFLHDRKIVHGDLKGANILVNRSGSACLADFGISSVLCPDVAVISTVCSVHSAGGTLLWQSPELMDNPRNTKASDVYAWACVAYQIFVGELPLQHLVESRPHDTEWIKREIKSGERPSRPPDSSPSWNGWGLTEQIWGLMKECWAAIPAARPTADDVVDRLTSMLSPKDIQLRERTRRNSMALYRQEARAGSPRHVELTVEFFNSLVGFSNQNEVSV